MKYKEFVEWCNERAQDGRWGFVESVICIEVMREINKQLPWRREKMWKEKEQLIIQNIVTPTNILINNLKDLS